MRTNIYVYTYVHTVKLATGPKGIGLNLDNTHPIKEELVTQAGVSKEEATMMAMMESLATRKEDEEEAEVLNDYFVSVFSEETTCLQDNCPPGLGHGVREQNGPLITQEVAVRELLKCLDIRKSMGPDGIHPRVMRELADELAEPLSIIYQQSWLTGEVLDNWKLANVTPIDKKGAKEDPDNYRPVSLTSVPGKIMEQFLLSAITQNLQDGQGIRPSQHGLGGTGHV
ncbi:hypothetical protein DUI87_06574 [Hirundo rustica rustica]|uniref:Reverse transcriptase domain-containing protein n=1 Tax=Hirundo rustica rustica TaxID=333673 RepID=A0A3M0KUM8_HIRRU|nr:hypothetical protein DUI87_06574 [Hirundo rustica rustica]